jgi:hypothetical protein
VRRARCGLVFSAAGGPGRKRGARVTSRRSTGKRRVAGIWSDAFKLVPAEVVYEEVVNENAQRDQALGGEKLCQREIVEVVR